VNLTRRGDGRARRTRHAYHHGNLREALLDATVETLKQGGVGSLSLRGAARRAGVSHAAPSHHFGDVAGLVAAVATRGYLRLCEAMTRAATKHRDPLKAVRAAGLAYVIFALRDRELFRVMFRASVADRESHPELERASTAALDLLVARIAQCRKARLVRRGSARSLALLAWAAMHGLAVLAVDGQLRAKGFRGQERRLANSMTQRLFLGLRAR
jgi:AcrR family transcriptional regulator